MWATLAFAQAPAARFEVASVKQIPGVHPPPDDVEMNLLRPVIRNGRFTMKNAPLSLLIQAAYNVKDFQVQGAPAWVNADRYDVIAKADGDATSAEMRPMLQALLAERFKLKLRRESKEFPVYDLVAAKGGFKIQSAKEGSCITLDPASPPTPSRPANICGGLRRTMVTAAPDRTDRVDAFSIAMPKLIEVISSDVRRTVVDKTGFTEKFDLHLEFAPGDSTGAPDAAPSIFTALQQQLGLRLESSKQAVEVLVIEHVEKASEN